VNVYDPPGFAAGAIPISIQDFKSTVQLVNYCLLHA
jgi:hypothetical protein